MFRCKTVGRVANNVGRRVPLKLLVAGAFVAGALGAFAIKTAWATPPQGFTSTSLIGPVTLDEFDTFAHTEDWKARLKTQGVSDVYVTNLKIVPGGHGGWHSHPGPSIITVKSGTATFYDECNAFFPQSYPAGTGFVEDAGCVHLLANEGNVDLEVIVMQIVPRGAPRRIDEPAPF
jgi:quercetin dioxygenase-like cupin family protein